MLLENGYLYSQNRFMQTIKKEEKSVDTLNLFPVLDFSVRFTTKSNNNGLVL